MSFEIFPTKTIVYKSRNPGIKIWEGIFKAIAFVGWGAGASKNGGEAAIFCE